MNIDSVAILIPTHPPHYNYLYNFITKLDEKNIQISIYIVFSTNEDYLSFVLKDKVRPIIVDEPINTRSITTFKKFFGLKTINKTSYKYIICCDSEIDIIPENFTKQNIMNKLDSIFENKLIYAGKTEGEKIRNVTQTSANLFPKYQELLQKITENFTLYFWWSDIPIYRTTDLEDFFNTINYQNIVWEHFDHLIYLFYLIIKYNFQIINTTPFTQVKWSLEYLSWSQDIDVLNKLSELKYGFSWVTKSLYTTYRDYLISHGSFIIYHLDRNC